MISPRTQSIAPQDRRVQRPKHVELIGFIIKPLLLHLVDVYIIDTIFFLSIIVSVAVVSAK
jgi:hypothetical protein